MRFRSALVLCMLVPMIARAQQSPATPLDALERLVGTWVARDTAAARRGEVIKMTYRWGQHRKTFHYDIVRAASERTVPTHEGMSWWDPTKQRIVFAEVDNHGNVVAGVFNVAGDRVDVEETITLADGRVIEVKGEVVFRGPDAFTFRASTRRGDSWVPAVQLEYARAKPSRSE